MDNHKKTPREIWKPVPLKEWEDRYEVSNFGRVRSVYNERRKRKPPWILASYITNRGYLRVHLCKGNSRKSDFLVQKFGIHQLVALAFIGPPPHPKSHAHHKDDNPKNNRDWNLEWLTPAAHRRHHSKMSWDKVRELRARAAKGEPPTRICADYGICFGTACAIVRRESWQE